MSATVGQVLSSAQLRREINARNIDRNEESAYELGYGASASVIFLEENGRHGNFLAASYRRILANPQWSRRLKKSYTANRYVPRAGDRQRFELECASSSDALLMNIFCYPKLLQTDSICRLLGIERGLQPEFGFRPAIPFKSGRVDRTEVDMRLDSLLVEAKLTEGNFQRAPLRLLARYRELERVFDVARLPVRDEVAHSYQLIRSVLAADASGGSFVVFCDRRRSDLMERWFEILQAVVDASLRTRLGLITWQEISAAAPERVRRFLEEKYGICA